GRLRHPPGTRPLPGFTGYRARRSGNTYPQAAGPGRASPVPAATIDAFRAPYAGESLAAALPGFYIASMAFAPTPRGSALPRPTPSGGLSNDAAGFASCYGPHRRSPYRAFDAGLRPR